MQGGTGEGNEPELPGAHCYRSVFSKVTAIGMRVT